MLILGAPVLRRDLIIGAVILLVAAWMVGFVRMPEEAMEPEQRQHAYYFGILEFCAQEYQQTHSELAKREMEWYLKRVLRNISEEVVRYQLLADGIEVVVATRHGPELLWVRFD